MPANDQMQQQVAKFKIALKQGKEAEKKLRDLKKEIQELRTQSQRLLQR
jgi:hypothetical protein